MDIRARKRIVRALLALVATIGVYAGYLIFTDNFHTVIAGQLYRSAQPSPQEISEWHKRYGIKTIINLRGARHKADWYRKEKAAAESLGIKLIDHEMSAHREVYSKESEQILASLRRRSGRFFCIAGTVLTAQAWCPRSMSQPSRTVPSGLQSFSSRRSSVTYRFSYFNRTLWTALTNVRRPASDFLTRRRGWLDITRVPESSSDGTGRACASLQLNGTRMMATRAKGAGWPGHAPLEVRQY